MRTPRLATLLAVTLAAVVPAHADEVPSGPEAGLRTPLLDMGQTQVVGGMNPRGNYGGGT